MAELGALESWPLKTLPDAKKGGEEKIWICWSAVLLCKGWDWTYIYLEVKQWGLLLRKHALAWAARVLTVFKFPRRNAGLKYPPSVSRSRAGNRSFQAEASTHISVDKAMVILFRKIEASHCPGRT